MKLHTLLISFLCSASAFANATDVPIKRGMSFSVARQALIENGWKANSTYSGEYGVENVFMREGFIEIESCTEGVRYCSFNYKKNSVCLGVGTVGEELEDMKIYSWNFECPETE
ncbi:hypothetical protein [Pseudomonas sp. TWP3-2]|uniref:hypothetical protein n=1 Tax=Pseudomonas sp. TWP3-2 TaxID=2804574 RepID=UPI003CE7100F